MPRPTVSLELTAEERVDLETIATSRSMPHGLVRRAQLILRQIERFVTDWNQANEIPSATREIKGKIRAIAKSWSSPARLVVASFAITTS